MRGDWQVRLGEVGQPEAAQVKRSALLRSRDWLPVHVPPGIAAGDLVTLRRSVVLGEVPGVVVPVQLVPTSGRAQYFPLLPEERSRSMIQPDPHVPLLVLDPAGLTDLGVDREEQVIVLFNGAPHAIIRGVIERAGDPEGGRPDQDPGVGVARST